MSTFFFWGSAVGQWHQAAIGVADDAPMCRPAEISVRAENNDKEKKLVNAHILQKVGDVNLKFRQRQQRSGVRIYGSQEGDKQHGVMHPLGFR